VIIDVYTNDESLVPVSKTEGSAGFDIRCPEDTFVTSRIGEVSIDTRLTLDGGANSEMFGILLLPRSGLSAKLDIRLKNTVGLIDKDYNGPEDRMKLIIKMPFILWLKHFLSRKPLFKKGDRICQIVYIPVLKPTHRFFHRSSNSNMNRGGFGSTGIK